jgi:hypothetical protein
VTRADQRGTIERRELLLTVSAELGDLSASATALQAALSDLLMKRREAGEPDHGMWQMQDIDRLQQTLEDLSAILRKAAESDGQRLDVDSLTAETKLGALRDLLGGGDSRAIPSQTFGIVALF